ncbi:MAG TPA: AMP-binding protein [Pyrinomonadaceae bacterium]|nr:AMP-binding protein [Pyrinomonadaceae bacterium]
MSAKSGAARGVRVDRERAHHDALRRAHCLDLSGKCAGRAASRSTAWDSGADGRSPPAASTIERLEDELGWTITHFYGLTETTPFITVCEPRPEHAELSSGERAKIKARQGVELMTSGELRVVDEDGNEVPRDGETQGEIVARGNAIMAGYYNDPEATEQVMRGGWFHTGDAAVVHPDGYPSRFAIA